MNSVQYMVTVRRDRLKQELRDEILAAARELFVGQGYDNVSMRRIADKVGCAPGTLYLHFEDKDAILDAICQETFHKLSERMQAIASDKGEPLERLRRGGRAYIQFGLDHPYHYLLTFGTLRPSDRKGPVAAAEGHSCFNCLVTCVGECVAAGLTRKTDVMEIAQSLWAPMHGIVMLIITKCGFPFIERDRLIDSILDISIEGIRKR